jgi:hypothetical protein
MRVVRLNWQPARTQRTCHRLPGES